MRKTISELLHIAVIAVGLASAVAYVVERINSSCMKQHFSEALEAADAGRWYWDLRTNEVRWDDQMYRLFGRAKSEFVPTFEGFEQCLHPDDRPRVRDEVLRAIAEKGGYHDTFRVITNSGKIVEVRAAGLVSRDGTYMTGINLPVKPRTGNFLRERTETGSGLPFYVHYAHDRDASSGQVLPEATLPTQAATAATVK